ncbi:uncharacterized protein LOC120189138 [Hibiscus syriacus]|uniref:uncharacterized protein LOC120189138 n=1 Tax=Hibiscus syriacus TaxID=106335 RepID=UPI001923005D|nr:uncharacterized protein LOC120189138 [Hibiscus syriacus]
MEYTADQPQQYQNQAQPQYQNQAHEYDPSHYHHQYYAYANQQRQYPYYPPQDSYSQQYSHFYQEVAPIHPPGVPLVHPTHPPVYYHPPQPSVDPQHQQGVPVSGSDSSAVAANYVGNVDLARRDNWPRQMQSAYRGGRGKRPSRGGRLGHAGHGHNDIQHSPNVVAPDSVLDPNGAAAAMLPTASVPGHATLTSQVPAAPLRPPPRMAWCELCRVDCNRPEILEKHKNGKRHKKNLQAREELQKRNKVISGQQSMQVPNMGFEGKQHQQDMVPSLAATNDNKKEIEQQQDIADKREASTTGPAETKTNLTNASEARSCGLKRKMRGGRGGKYMKRNEGSRPFEPPKPKFAIPFMCELCNVKCESQVVFNSHLAGKKHIANTKRFHGHRALYGEAGLQALYPPNINDAPPPLIPPIQQGVTDPQVALAQLLTCVLIQAQAQVPGLAAHLVSLPIAALESAQTPLLSSGNQYSHEIPQGSLATSEVRNGLAAMAEAETWRQNTAAKSEASPAAGDNKANSQASQSEKNEVSRQQSFTAKSEAPTTVGTVKVKNGALDKESKAVITPMDNPTIATPTTEGKTVSLDPVDGSEPNNDLKEAEEDPEEEAEEDPEDEAEEDVEEQNEAD